MKKTVSAILVLCMAFLVFLTACNKNSDNSSGKLEANSFLSIISGLSVPEIFTDIPAENSSVTESSAAVSSKSVLSSMAVSSKETSSKADSGKEDSINETAGVSNEKEYSIAHWAPETSSEPEIFEEPPVAITLKEFVEIQNAALIAAGYGGTAAFTLEEGDSLSFIQLFFGVEIDDDEVFHFWDDLDDFFNELLISINTITYCESLTVKYVYYTPDGSTTLGPREYK